MANGRQEDSGSVSSDSQSKLEESANCDVKYVKLGGIVIPGTICERF